MGVDKGVLGGAIAPPNFVGNLQRRKLFPKEKRPQCPWGVEENQELDIIFDTLMASS